MPILQNTITIPTQRQGLSEVTPHLEKALRQSNLANGLANLFCHHTSCSLVIMENADPSAQHDLEHFINHLVPETYPHFTHTLEGPDDMPSHIKMALTRTSETLPFTNNRLQLGTWQGIFLWEHRATPHKRKLTLTLYGE